MENVTHSFKGRHHCRWNLAKFRTIWSALTAFEQGGDFIVSYLLWHWTLLYKVLFKGKDRWPVLYKLPLIIMTHGSKDIIYILIMNFAIVSVPWKKNMVFIWTYYQRVGKHWLEITCRPNVGSWEADDGELCILIIVRKTFPFFWLFKRVLTLDPPGRCSNIKTVQKNKKKSDILDYMYTYTNVDKWSWLNVILLIGPT